MQPKQLPLRVCCHSPLLLDIVDQPLYDSDELPVSGKAAHIVVAGCSDQLLANILGDAAMGVERAGQAAGRL